MKSSTRYTLIALGFIVFLILAPLLIFYVSGRTIKFDGTDSDLTGILDAKSNPSSATLLINDKEHSSTPAIARFLKQGEYQFTLRKEGYYDWTKRLPIEASKVTYTQEGVTEVQLLKKSESEVLVPKGVSSFTLIGNEIWFTQGTNLVRASLSEIDKQTVIPLPFAPQSLTLLRDKKHLLAQGGGSVIIDTSSNKVLPRSPGDNFTENTVVISDTQIIYLDGDKIWLFDTTTNDIKLDTKLLRENVAGFTMLDNTAYFIDKQSYPSHRASITTAIWNGKEFVDTQPLLADIDIGSGQLIITDSKELFCHCTGQLFRIGQKLEVVNNSVATVHLDPQTNELSFLTFGNELQFYNFLTSKPQLLTRGGLTQQAAFLIRSSIGYGFIGTASGLEAIEIDERDKQNRYQLLNQRQVWQLGITDNQKTIIALQDGALVSLEIRN
jgi:hypothetical protein